MDGEHSDNVTDDYTYHQPTNLCNVNQYYQDNRTVAPCKRRHIDCKEIRKRKNKTIALNQYMGKYNYTPKKCSKMSINMRKCHCSDKKSKPFSNVNPVQNINNDKTALGDCAYQSDKDDDCNYSGEDFDIQEWMSENTHQQFSDDDFQTTKKSVNDSSKSCHNGNSVCEKDKSNFAAPDSRRYMRDNYPENNCGNRNYGIIRVNKTRKVKRVSFKDSEPPQRNMSNSDIDEYQTDIRQRENQSNFTGKLLDNQQDYTRECYDRDENCTFGEMYNTGKQRTYLETFKRKFGDTSIINVGKINESNLASKGEWQSLNAKQQKREGYSRQELNDSDQDQDQECDVDRNYSRLKQKTYGHPHQLNMDEYCNCHPTDSCQNEITLREEKSKKKTPNIITPDCIRFTYKEPYEIVCGTSNYRVNQTNKMRHDEKNSFNDNKPSYRQSQTNLKNYDCGDNQRNIKRKIIPSDFESTSTCKLLGNNTADGCCQIVKNEDCEFEKDYHRSKRRTCFRSPHRKTKNYETGDIQLNERRTINQLSNDNCRLYVNEQHNTVKGSCQEVQKEQCDFEQKISKGKQLIYPGLSQQKSAHSGNTPINRRPKFNETKIVDNDVCKLFSNDQDTAEFSYPEVINPYNNFEQKYNRNRQHICPEPYQRKSENSESANTKTNSKRKVNEVRFADRSILIDNEQYTAQSSYPEVKSPYCDFEKKGDTGEQWKYPEAPQRTSENYEFDDVQINRERKTNQVNITCKDVCELLGNEQHNAARSFSPEAKSPYCDLKKNSTRGRQHTYPEPFQRKSENSDRTQIISKREVNEPNFAGKDRSTLIGKGQYIAECSYPTAKTQNCDIEKSEQRGKQCIYLETSQSKRENYEASDFRNRKVNESNPAGNDECKLLCKEQQHNTTKYSHEMKTPYCEFKKNYNRDRQHTFSETFQRKPEKNSESDHTQTSSKVIGNDQHITECSYPTVKNPYYDFEKSENRGKQCIYPEAMQRRCENYEVGDSRNRQENAEQEAKYSEIETIKVKDKQQKFKSSESGDTQTNREESNLELHKTAEYSCQVNNQDCDFDQRSPEPSLRKPENCESRDILLRRKQKLGNLNETDKDVCILFGNAQHTTLDYSSHDMQNQDYDFNKSYNRDKQCASYEASPQISENCESIDTNLGRKQKINELNINVCNLFGTDQHDIAECAWTSGASKRRSESTDSNDTLTNRGRTLNESTVVGTDMCQSFGIGPHNTEENSYQEVNNQECKIKKSYNRDKFYTSPNVLKKIPENCESSDDQLNGKQNENDPSKDECKLFGNHQPDIAKHSGPEMKKPFSGFETNNNCVKQRISSEPSKQHSESGETQIKIIESTVVDAGACKILGNGQHNTAENSYQKVKNQDRDLKKSYHRDKLHPPAESSHEIRVASEFSETHTNKTRKVNESTAADADVSQLFCKGQLNKAEYSCQEVKIQGCDFDKSYNRDKPALQGKPRICEFSDTQLNRKQKVNESDFANKDVYELIYNDQRNTAECFEAPEVRNCDFETNKNKAKQRISPETSHRKSENSESGEIQMNRRQKVNEMTVSGTDMCQPLSNGQQNKAEYFCQEVKNQDCDFTKSYNKDKQRIYLETLKKIPEISESSDAQLNIKQNVNETSEDICKLFGNDQSNTADCSVPEVKNPYCNSETNNNKGKHHISPKSSHRNSENSESGKTQMNTRQKVNESTDAGEIVCHLSVNEQDNIAKYSRQEVKTLDCDIKKTSTRDKQLTFPETSQENPETCEFSDTQLNRKRKVIKSNVAVKDVCKLFGNDQPNTAQCPSSQVKNSFCDFEKNNNRGKLRISPDPSYRKSENADSIETHANRTRKVNESSVTDADVSQLLGKVQLNTAEYSCQEVKIPSCNFEKGYNRDEKRTSLEAPEGKPENCELSNIQQLNTKRKVNESNFVDNVCKLIDNDQHNIPTLHNNTECGSPEPSQLEAENSESDDIESNRRRQINESNFVSEILCRLCVNEQHNKAQHSGPERKPIRGKQRQCPIHPERKRRSSQSGDIKMKRKRKSVQSNYVCQEQKDANPDCNAIKMSKRHGSRQRHRRYFDSGDSSTKKTEIMNQIQVKCPDYPQKNASLSYGRRQKMSEECNIALNGSLAECEELSETNTCLCVTVDSKNEECSFKQQCQQYVYEDPFPIVCTNREMPKKVNIKKEDKQKTKAYSSKSESSKECNYQAMSNINNTKCHHCSCIISCPKSSAFFFGKHASTQYNRHLDTFSNENIIRKECDDDNDDLSSDLSVVKVSESQKFVSLPNTYKDPRDKTEYKSENISTVKFDCDVQKHKININQSKQMLLSEEDEDANVTSYYKNNQSERSLVINQPEMNQFYNDCDNDQEKQQCPCHCKSEINKKVSIRNSPLSSTRRGGIVVKDSLFVTLKRFHAEDIDDDKFKDAYLKSEEDIELNDDTTTEIPSVTSRYRKSHFNPLEIICHAQPESAISKIHPSYILEDAYVTQCNKPKLSRLTNGEYNYDCSQCCTYVTENDAEFEPDCNQMVSKQCSIGEGEFTEEDNNDSYYQCNAHEYSRHQVGHQQDFIAQDVLGLECNCSVQENPITTPQHDQILLGKRDDEINKQAYYRNNQNNKSLVIDQSKMCQFCNYHNNTQQPPLHNISKTKETVSKGVGTLVKDSLYVTLKRFNTENVDSHTFTDAYLKKHEDIELNDDNHDIYNDECSILKNSDGSQSEISAFTISPNNIPEDTHTAHYNKPKISRTSHMKKRQYVNKRKSDTYLNQSYNSSCGQCCTSSSNFIKDNVGCYQCKCPHCLAIFVPEKRLNNTKSMKPTQSQISNKNNSFTDNENGISDFSFVPGSTSFNDNNGCHTTVRRQKICACSSNVLDKRPISQNSVVYDQ